MWQPKQPASETVATFSLLRQMQGGRAHEASWRPGSATLS